MPTGLFLKRIAIDDVDAERADAYPFDLPAVRHLGERRLRSPVTVFVGENGSGKSTLLEAVAIGMGLNPEGGSTSLRFESEASHSDLHEHLRLGRGPRPEDRYFLRAESFYNVASTIDQLDRHPDHVDMSYDSGPPIIDSYGGRSLHHQSHGESFFRLALERFGPRGLYIMDEPESALSPQRQLALLARVHELVARGSQFVLATHAPILMAWPGADVWEFSADGIHETTARETEHWQLLRSFLNDPDNTLDALLQE